MRWSELDDAQRQTLERFVARLEEAGWAARRWHELLKAGLPCSPQGLAELDGVASQQTLSLELGAQALVWTVHARFVPYMLRVFAPAQALEPLLAILEEHEALLPEQAAFAASQLAALAGPVEFSVNGQPRQSAQALEALAGAALSGPQAAWEALLRDVVALHQDHERRGWSELAAGQLSAWHSLSALRALEPTLTWQALRERVIALGLSPWRAWSTLWPLWAPQRFGLPLPLPERSPPASVARWAWAAYRGELHKEDEPDQPLEALYDEALELIALGRLEAAQGALERALAARPAFTEAWHNLAAVARARGDEALAHQALTRALEGYQQQVQLDDEDAYAWFWLASVQLALGQPDEALRCLWRAIELEPSYGREALREPDLEALHQHPDLQAMLRERGLLPPSP